MTKSRRLESRQFWNSSASREKEEKQKQNFFSFFMSLSRNSAERFHVGCFHTVEGEALSGTLSLTDRFSCINIFVSKHTNIFTAFSTHEVIFIRMSSSQLWWWDTTSQKNQVLADILTASYLGIKRYIFWQRFHYYVVIAALWLLFWAFCHFSKNLFIIKQC